MQPIPRLALLGGAVIIGVIVLALLIRFVDWRGASSDSSGYMSSSTTPTQQSDGSYRGGEQYNLPGSPYYGNVTPPVYNGTPTTPATPPQDQVACTQEAMLCPDGSAVGRTGPNCAFAPCPGQ